MDALAAAFVAWGTVDWLQVSSILLGLFLRRWSATEGARELARAETARCHPWGGQGVDPAGGENVQRSTFSVKRSMIGNYGL